MPENADIPRLSSYFTACEALAESIFSGLPHERRNGVVTWSAAIMESLKDENISTSDLQLLFGTLAGIAVHEDSLPEGVGREDMRSHARNLLIGAFERGCDGISLLDLQD